MGIDIPYTVGTTPVKIARYDKSRKKLTIQNQDSSTTVYVGKNNPNISSSGANKGKEVLPKQLWVNSDPDCRDEYWAYAASSITIMVTEDFA